MTNPITEAMLKGTYGEILVQLRLLEYEVQAAPPIKDSGNDLIAIRGECFKAIQVKTRSIDDNDRIRVGDLPNLYHILAIVVLHPAEDDRVVSLDRSLIFLLEKDEVYKSQFSIEELIEFELSRSRIDALFG